MRELQLDLETPINSEVLSEFIEYLPNIETLELSGKFSYLSLDRLSNLKRIKLFGTIMNDFDFDLFDNLCNQLESITISSQNIDDECLSKLFYGRNFPYLSSLFLTHTTITKLEKENFNGFPMLRLLFISERKQLRIIENDVFSNLKKLSILVLMFNCLENIKENAFSNLENLENLKLILNQLTSLDPKSFVGLRSLKILDLSKNKLSHFDLGILDNIPQIEEIDLSENPIINKEEIWNYSLSSKIKFIF